MIVSVLQEKLNKGLSAVVRVVPSKPSLPVLSNVLLEVIDGRLRLSGTDLNLGVRIWIGAKVKKEGAISIPAKVMSELVSSFPPETIELELEGDALRIACGSHRARLAGIGASEFPALGKVSQKKEFPLSVESFQTAIARVAFAASSDETRPALSGVLLTYEREKLRLVATDGYRLSLDTLSPSPAPQKKSDAWGKMVQTVVGGSLIVPARALVDVARLIDELEVSQVRVGLVSNQNLVVFSLGDGEVSSRLIEGPFPDFSQVLPKEERSTAEIDLEVLEKAVRTASVFARDSANIVRWNLNKDGLTVSANAPSYGESESRVDVSLSGEGGEIAFNSRYLLELFSIFPGERLAFAMNGALDPGVFRPIEKGSAFTHLVMPVRVQK